MTSDSGLLPDLSGVGKFGYIIGSPSGGRLGCVDLYREDGNGLSYPTLGAARIALRLVRGRPNNPDLKIYPVLGVRLGDPEK